MTTSMGGIRRWVATAAILALAGGLAACSADDATPSAGGSWTVLQYSIADTDLEPFMMDDVAEMGDVGTQEDLSIVALVDRSGDYSDAEVLDEGDWVGGRILEITPGGSTQLADLGDVNTGDPQVLADFINRGITDYPADNYALIISDHGASWPGVGADGSFDDDSLSLAEIHQGISDGLDAAGVEKLSLLGFDACLMATYEVASSMAPLAERMLASQELEPGHGWDYTALGTVAAHGGATADELGRALIDGFESQAKDEGTQAEITLSLIDLTALPALDDALASFSTALGDRAADIAPVVGRSLASTLGFGRSPDPDQDSYMTDLAILAGEIGVDALDVSDQADDVVRAVNDAVVDKVDGQATTGATGLSIYFPPTGDYYDTDYDSLEQGGGWAQFLSSYYSAGNAIPAGDEASFASDGAEVSFDDDGLVISASFDDQGAENLSEAFIRYGIAEDDGSVTFLGQEPAEIDTDSGVVTGTYDLSYLEISDGEDTTSAYLDMTFDDDAGVTTMDVPLGYYTAEDVEGETYQNAQLSLVVDNESGELINESYYTYDPETGNFGALTADPNGIISPELLTVHDDGSEEWFATSDYGLYADLPSLTYDFPTLESGTRLYVELFVLDYAGNRATVSAMVTVP